MYNCFFLREALLQTSKLTTRVGIKMDYLSELLKEKKQLSLFPNFFPHLERLLQEEIARVHFSVFRYDIYSDSIKLPEPKGEMVQLQQKVYIPLKKHPEYNFVGRILGPRGMTAKQLEQETGCKIMIRGKGSMRDSVKEELTRGKPNYEHLDDELHVLIQCEDTRERAIIKLNDATNHIKKLLVPPAAKGIDELKRKQLMELAIINGTYRPNPQIKNRTPMVVPSLFSTPPLSPQAILSGGVGGSPLSPQTFRSGSGGGPPLSPSAFRNGSGGAQPLSPPAFRNGSVPPLSPPAFRTGNSGVLPPLSPQDILNSDGCPSLSPPAILSGIQPSGGGGMSTAEEDLLMDFYKKMY